MRVLYVNWVDPLDPEQRGGGVSVYQRNLIDAFAHLPQHEAAFLSVGTAYDLRPGPPRSETVRAHGKTRHFLVNSGLTAPSHAAFHASAQLHHQATQDEFAHFLKRTGPWDIVHFNNLEGLPAEALEARAQFPGTRFVLSLHNYYPFCPQVNLWHAETAHCTDFEGGARCATCLPVTPSTHSVRFVYRVNAALAQLGLGPGTPLYRGLAQPVLGLAWRSLRKIAQLRRLRHGDAPNEPSGRLPKTQPSNTQFAPHFAHRRARMVGLINTHCDAVIGVSQRVTDIAAHYGIARDRLHTLYIGTRAAKVWQQTAPKPALIQPDSSLRLAYLGYMRRDKGFHFLMEALTRLPPEIAQRLHLTVAARQGDAPAMAALDTARRHLANLTHVDGYTHDGLDALLSGVDVGLVPVMWEDNLPQVAIEMHARHIPLITSDRGGAQELGNCPDMTFQAGSASDFQRVLERVLAGAVSPEAYWANAMAPVSMSEHMEALFGLYESLR